MQNLIRQGFGGPATLILQGFGVGIATTAVIVGGTAVVQNTVKIVSSGGALVGGATEKPVPTEKIVVHLPDSPIGWKCNLVGSYVPAAYVDVQSFMGRSVQVNRRLSAKLPGITICNQKLYSLMPKTPLLG